MHDYEDGTRVPAKSSNGPSNGPSNAFTQDFLTRLEQEDEPSIASEAAVAGVGSVQPLPGGGFGVFLSGESPERGHPPVAAFRERWRAQLAAAVLPGTGRDPLVILRKKADPQGYALLAGLTLDGQPDVVGHLRVFDEALVSALHVAEALLRAPGCLAALLRAAGRVGLERTGTELEQGD